MDFAIFPSSICLQCRGDAHAQDAKIRECHHWDRRMLPVSVWRVLAAALGLALVPAQYQVTRSDPLARLAGVLRWAERRYLSVSTIDIRAILDIVVFISIFRVFNMSGQAGTNVTLSCPANTKVTNIYLDTINYYTSQCPSFAKISIMQKSKYLFISCLMHN